MPDMPVVEIDLNEPKSGAENHPSDYAIPGVTASVPAPAPTPAAPAATPATPAAPAPAAPATPAAVAPAAPPSVPTPQPGSPETPAPGAEPPQYRFNEVIEQRNRAADAYQRQRDENEQLRQQNATITALLQRLMNGGTPAGQPSGAAPAAPASPADEAAMKALERLYAVAPHLKKLEPIAARVDEILGFTTEMVPRMQERERQYWETVSQHMYGRLWEAVAPRVLGDGKTANDLAQPVRDRYARDFFNWLHEDRSRGTRYARLDPTLVNDFISEIESAYVAPVRQRYGAEVTQRAQAQQNLPVAGPAQAPVATPAPQVNFNDETAVHDAAWKQLVAAAGR